MHPSSMLSMPKNDEVVGRQTAFFAAFVLPVYKLLELPSILARFTGGDLLLPAFLQYLLQTGVLFALIFVASRLDKPIFQVLEERIGKWALVFYFAYALYFLLASVLPLLDLEKFVYAIFYDTSPTLFAFAFFFLFSAFVCTKGVKSLGRFADLSLFLFVLPFFALLFMSIAEADATNLLPFFERKFEHTMYAMSYSSPHFSDVALLLPFIGNLRYKKNDNKKILIGYGAGGVFTLLFLSVFYGLYSSIAAREHYAFAKIAQYFPALTVIGRVDLLFVYALTVVLFVFTATPLFCSIDFVSRAVGTRRRALFSAIVNLAAFVFVLFGNRHYDKIYALFGKGLFPIFWVFSILIPLSVLFLLIKPKKQKQRKKETSYA